MIKMLQGFGLMIGYLVAWSPLFLLGGLAVQNGEEGIGAAVLIGSTIGVLVGIFPFMHWMAGWLFFFSGEGEAVETAVLRQQLFAISEQEQWPVRVVEKGSRLIVSWKYADAHWWGVLSRSGLKHVYELHIRLNEKRQTATLIDVNKSVQWHASPTQVRIWGGYSRGVDLTFERVIGYGWNDAFQFEKVVDYRFENSRLKQPVINMVIAHGWNVKFGLW